MVSKRSKVILLYLICVSACGQSKGVSSPYIDKPLKVITEGLPCVEGDSSSGTSIDGGFMHWTATSRGTPYSINYNEIWICLNSKWHRDKDAEIKRDIHDKLVQDVRNAITTRRLRKDEIKIIDDVLGISNGAFTCGENGCEPMIKCEQQAVNTAILISQLDFWKPSESELPLSFLEQYVKGMTCNSGTGKAYKIMNDRIIDWLKNK